MSKLLLLPCRCLSTHCLPSLLAREPPGSSSTPTATGPLPHLDLPRRRAGERDAGAPLPRAIALLRPRRPSAGEQHQKDLANEHHAQPRWTSRQQQSSGTPTPAASRPRCIKSDLAGAVMVPPRGAPVHGC